MGFDEMLVITVLLLYGAVVFLNFSRKDENY